MMRPALNRPPAQLQLPDGRQLAYHEFGDPTGIPACYCHGFPSSGREAMLVHDQALALGIRLIAPDRPGYGGSSIQPDRQIRDWPTDLAVLAETLGLESFALIGVSGGAPYTLATLAALPERIRGCALVCPLGPVYLDAVLEQMTLTVQTTLRIGHQPRWMIDLLFANPITEGLKRWPGIVGQIRHMAAAEPDRRALAMDDGAAILDSTIEEAMAHGAPGAKQDLELYLKPWDIDFSRLQTPIRLWHGDRDETVPLSHSRWYAEHLPQAHLEVLHNEGHFSLPLRYGETMLRPLLQD